MAKEKIQSIKKDDEREIIVFYTCFSNTYGRFIVNYEGKRQILFELIEDGLSERNEYTMIKRMTKKEYEEICARAQNCYNKLIQDMFNGHDCSWTWNFD